MTIAILLLNLLPALLGNIPGISDKIKQIIAAVVGSTNAIIQSGSITAPSIQTILAAWAGVLAVLKSDPGLPANKLGLIDELSKIVSAALLEDTVAAAKVDWTKFTLTANV